MVTSVGGGAGGQAALLGRSRQITLGGPTAYQPLFDQLAGILSMPVAYQISRDWDADYLFFALGRVNDTAGGLSNGNMGVRLFRGSCFSSGWQTSYYGKVPLSCVWTQPADVVGYIPWSGRGLDMVIEFWSTVSAINASLEFSLQPYSG